MAKVDLPGYLGSFNTDALATYLDDHLKNAYRVTEMEIRKRHPDAPPSLVEIATWHAIGKMLGQYGESIVGIQNTTLKHYLRNNWRCRMCRARVAPVVYNGKVICGECAHEFPDDSSLIGGIVDGGREAGQ